MRIVYRAFFSLLLIAQALGMSTTLNDSVQTVAVTQSATYTIQARLFPKDIDTQEPISRYVRDATWGAEVTDAEWSRREGSGQGGRIRYSISSEEDELRSLGKVRIEPKQESGDEIGVWEFPTLEIPFLSVDPDFEISAVVGLDQDYDLQPDLHVYTKSEGVYKKEATAEIQFADVSPTPKGKGYLIRRELGWGGDEKWYYDTVNTTFHADPEETDPQGGLQVTSQYDDQGEEFVVLQRRFDAIDLETYPLCSLKVKTSHGARQQFVLIANLDLDGNKRPDGIVTSPVFDGPTSMKSLSFDILAAAKTSFPNKQHYRLLEVVIYLKKNPTLDCSNNPEQMSFVLDRFSVYREVVSADSVALSSVKKSPDKVEATMSLSEAHGWQVATINLGEALDRAGKGRYHIVTDIELHCFRRPEQPIGYDSESTALIGAPRFVSTKPKKEPGIFSFLEQIPDVTRVVQATPKAPTRFSVKKAVWRSPFAPPRVLDQERAEIAFDGWRFIPDRADVQLIRLPGVVQVVLQPDASTREREVAQLQHDWPEQSCEAFEAIEIEGFESTVDPGTVVIEIMDARGGKMTIEPEKTSLMREGVLRFSLVGPQKVSWVDAVRSSTPSVSPPVLGEKTLQTRSFFSLPRDRGRCRRGLKSVSQTFCGTIKTGEGSHGSLKANVRAVTGGVDGNEPLSAGPSDLRVWDDEFLPDRFAIRMLEPEEAEHARRPVRWSLSSVRFVPRSEDVEPVEYYLGRDERRTPHNTWSVQSESGAAGIAQENGIISASAEIEGPHPQRIYVYSVIKPIPLTSGQLLRIRHGVTDAKRESVSLVLGLDTDGDGRSNRTHVVDLPARMLRGEANVSLQEVYQDEDAPIEPWDLVSISFVIEATPPEGRKVVEFQLESVGVETWTSGDQTGQDRLKVVPRGVVSGVYDLLVSPRSAVSEIRIESRESRSLCMLDKQADFAITKNTRFQVSGTDIAQTGYTGWLELEIRSPDGLKQRRRTVRRPWVFGESIEIWPERNEEPAIQVDRVKVMVDVPASLPFRIDMKGIEFSEPSVDLESILNTRMSGEFREPGAKEIPVVLNRRWISPIAEEGPFRIMTGLGGFLITGNTEDIPARMTTVALPLYGDSQQTDSIPVSLKGTIVAADVINGTFTLVTSVVADDDSETHRSVSHSWPLANSDFEFPFLGLPKNADASLIAEKTISVSAELTFSRKPSTVYAPFAIGLRDARWTVLPPPTTVQRVLNDLPLFEIDDREFHAGSGIIGDVTKPQTVVSKEISRVGIRYPEDGAQGYWATFGEIRLTTGSHAVEVFDNPIVETKLIKIEESKRPGEEEVPPPKTDFWKINPTRYLVKISAEKAFWLVLSESFHDGWKAQILRGAGPDGDPMQYQYWSEIYSQWREPWDRHQIEKHELVNGYANGWWIPFEQLREDGVIENESFWVVLEFYPQRYFEVGALISLTTLLVLIVCLFVSLTRRFLKHRQQKQQESPATPVE